MNSLVVLSGGIDSTVALASALEDEDEEHVEAITFTYGQKHADAELDAARRVVEYYQIPHTVEHLPSRMFRDGALM
ncbi:MAG TPA: 7-cyano-7-deazaguanine synthase, partial [Ktedonobacteraceae bacterium]